MTATSVHDPVPAGAANPSHDPTNRPHELSYEIGGVTTRVADPFVVDVTSEPTLPATTSGDAAPASTGSLPVAPAEVAGVAVQRQTLPEPGTTVSEIIALAVIGLGGIVLLLRSGLRAARHDP